MDNAQSVNILMQFTDAEIASSRHSSRFYSTPMRSTRVTPEVSCSSPVELGDERPILAGRYVSNSRARSTSGWRCPPWCYSALTAMVMSPWPSFTAVPTNEIPRETYWAVFRLSAKSMPRARTGRIWTSLAELSLPERLSMDGRPW